MIVAGNTAEQIGAAWQLWLQWCAEEDRAEPDYAEFLEYVLTRISTGRWFYLIAWDGDTPVGMVEACHWYDPFERRTIGLGDRAFIAKSHRGTGVFRDLVREGYDLLVGFGATKIYAPANAAGPVAFTRQAYERMGFQLTGYSLSKEIEQ